MSFEQIPIPQNIKTVISRALIVGIVVWIGIVFFSLNWSSLGKWNDYLAPRTERHVLLGQPRGIRSDEWLVLTPLMMAVSSYNSKGSDELSDFAGPPGAELLMNQPVRHFSTLFRPQMWGFFLFDRDRGLSFFWAAKIVGLSVTFFAVLLLLTQHTLISIAGTLWLLLSSFMQWWLSIALPEIVSNSLASMLCAFAILSTRNRSILIASWIGLVVFSVNLALCAYPPFIVPASHAAAAIGAALVIKYGVVSGAALWRRLGMLSLGGVVVGGVLVLFYVDIADIIAIVSNTVYPGRRVSSSGGVPLARIFTGLGDTLFSEGRFPPRLANVCEAAGFMLIWPLVVPVVAYRFLRKKISSRDFLSYVPLLLVLGLHCAWMFFYVPDSLGMAVGLTLVPGIRALIGAGVLSIIVVAMTTAWAPASKVPTWKLISSVLVGGVLAFYVGQELEAAAPRFFSLNELLIISAAIGIAGVGLLIANPVVFWLPILILVTPNLLVNPVATGTAPLTQRELIRVAEKIREGDPKARWIVFGEGAFGNLLKVSGVRVFNGVVYAPRMDDYKVLDPSGDWASVYNRYAHITVNSAPQGSSPTFAVVQGDSFLLTIHPCDSGLETVGIKYFVFSYPPSGQETSCLEFVQGPLSKKFYLYRRKYLREAPSPITSGSS